MPIIQVFGIGFGSKSANVTSQQRVNLYLEPQKDNDKSPLVLYGTPGLTLHANIGDAPSRGMAVIPIAGADWIITVNGDQAWSVSPVGVITLLGTLNTSGSPVSMAWNGTQLIIVDGTDGWLYTPAASTWQAVRTLDADFPTRPDTITWMNGYFVVSQGGTGKFWWSALGDGTSWDGLDFATAESFPDNLQAVYSDYGELYLMGDNSLEIWTPSDDANIWVRQGGAAAEWGLASLQTIAKWQQGIVFLGRNRLGECQVVAMQGYTAVPLTDFEVSNSINAHDDLSTATGFSYLIDGQAFYQLNLLNASYLYNSASGSWSVLSSGTEGGRHLANHRAALTQAPYVSDYGNGNIYLLDKGAYDDNGDTLIRQVTTRHVFHDNDRQTIWELWVDFEEGVGLTTGQGDDPQVMLQYSKDGGHTWSNELWQTIGALGTYGTRVVWRRLGQARDWVFRLRISDPVKVVMIGAGIRFE